MPEAARVTREPLTYERHGQHSYFQDLFLRDKRPEAQVRLNRHAQEMDHLSRERDEKARRGLPTDMETREMETRAPSRTQGSGGYFTPPAWLNEYFATAPRAPRVLADLAPNFALPTGVGQLNLPILTTGVVEQSTADNGTVPDQDMIDAANTANVVTIDGMADVALQTLEQSPQGAHLDFVIYKDMRSAYDAQLETQLVNGLGNTTAGGGESQILGILNVTNVNGVTYTDSTPTFSEMNPFIGQTAAAVGNNRKLPPELWLMTTSRWAWIGTQQDTATRPIVTPSVEPPREDGSGAVASMLGWPIYPDDAVPINLGAGGNQDRIIACRPSDLMVLEGEERTSINLDVLSGTLGARIIMHRYVAAFTARYPKSISVLSGSGMAIQSGF